MTLQELLDAIYAVQEMYKLSGESPILITWDAEGSAPTLYTSSKESLLLEYPVEVFTFLRHEL